MVSKDRFFKSARNRFVSLVRGKLEKSRELELTKGNSVSLYDDSVFSLPRVTRIEFVGGKSGRITVLDASDVEVHVQDGGHTLKVFLRRTGTDVLWEFGENWTNDPKTACRNSRAHLAHNCDC